MTKYKGFETIEEAKKFRKENGGQLCGSQMKSKKLRKYHQFAVVCGGLNGKKYPYSVQWND